MKRIKRFLKAYLYRLHNGQEPVQQVTQKPGETRELRDRPLVNLVLFGATFFTTTLAGSHAGSTFPEYFMSGLPYSFTIMTILLVHEFGHYFAARKFSVKTTLPFFIPIFIPHVVNIGTMGAVIKTRSPIPNRRALLFIGAMGPLPGFLVSLGAVIIGIYLSDVKPLPQGIVEFPVPIFGDSLLFRLIIICIHGNIPVGHDIYLSPYAWAGWIGFLITSLNLMPLGQLDGSHILYALIGRKQVIAGWSTFVLLILLLFKWPGWIVWIILTLLMLMVAHPYIPEEKKLSIREKIIGWLCMGILVLTFIPEPVTFLEGGPTQHLRFSQQSPPRLIR